MKTKQSKSDQRQLTTKQRIAKIEERIAQAEALLQTLRPGRGVGLIGEIAKLRRQKELEKVHALSGFNRIRPRKVSGSYGSGKGK